MDEGKALCNPAPMLELLRCCTVKLESLLLQKAIGCVSLRTCAHAGPFISPLPSISTSSLFDTQVRTPPGCVFTAQTQKHLIYLEVYVKGWFKSAGKWRFFSTPNPIPETLSALTAGWLHRELQEVLCSLRARFRTRRDSLPACCRLAHPLISFAVFSSPLVSHSLTS